MNEQYRREVMIDPCEKQQKEYQSALNEEIKAKDIVNTPKRPLGQETPPPSNKSDIVVWKEKERIRKEKKQALDDCKKKHSFSRQQ